MSDHLFDIRFLYSKKIKNEEDDSIINDILSRISGELNEINNYHIIYYIEFRRWGDGAKKGVHKRYSELRDFYEKLVEKEMIDETKEYEFPEKLMALFNDDLLNPKSKLIRKRKKKLEKFFQKLFIDNQTLYREPMVIEFFSMEGFFPTFGQSIDNASFLSDSTMSVASNYSDAHTYHSDSIYSRRDSKRGSLSKAEKLSEVEEYNENEYEDDEDYSKGTICGLGCL